MKKIFKYTFLTILLFAISFFVIRHFIPINGVTYSVQETIESIDLDNNITVKDAIIKLAGVNGEVIWEREKNDYFVSIVHENIIDSIKFSYNPNTGYIFLTGFYRTNEKKCEGGMQAKLCLYNRLLNKLLNN